MSCNNAVTLSTKLEPSNANGKTSTTATSTISPAAKIFLPTDGLIDQGVDRPGREG